MRMSNIKFEVSDPSFYDALILDQKKKLAQNPRDAMQWVELGRLQEAKAQMTSHFAQKNMVIKWIPICTYLFVLSALYIYFKNAHHVTPSIIAWPFIIFCIFTTLIITIIRYPCSGKKYFKKAIFLDPSNADAHMYLGFIALRRFQSKKAYSLLERACQLGNSRKLERELKTIYEKEFIGFFNQKLEKEQESCQIIVTLQDRIKNLETELTNLSRKNSTALKKAQTTKAKTGKTIRQAKVDMEHQISRIQTDYEKQIADLEQLMEEEEAQKEATQKKNLNLSLEILEAKSQTKKQSFNQAAKQAENILGQELWRLLSENTRSYLATAEHAFSMLDKTSAQTDFSLVGMELCKALETEINRALIVPFTKEMNQHSETFLKINKTGEIKGIPLYYTMLAKVLDNKNYPEITTLTLGQYLFVLKKTLEGEFALDDYASYLDSIFESSKIVVGRKFLQKLRTVTDGYRNSIVHYTHMNHQQCLRLRELIYSKQDSLMVVCCKINTHFSYMKNNL